MRDLIRVLVIRGIIWGFKFIDWRERREQRYPVFKQDW